MSPKFTVHIRPAKQRFSRRKQWRFEIIAPNGEPIDPRDTYANPSDIGQILAELIAGDTPVVVVVHYPNRTSTEALR